MSDLPADRPVYEGGGFFIDTATGRQVQVRFAYYRQEDGGLIMRMTRLDGTPAPPWPIPADAARMLDAFFFPDGTGGGQTRETWSDPPVATVVNIDGSPRNKLRDRLAKRRRTPSSLVATLVAIIGAALRLGAGCGMWCNLAGGFGVAMG